MTRNTITNWDTDLIDIPSITVATKIATLHGGESITIKSLGGSSAFHYIGMKHRVELSRGYKLAGGEVMTLTLPITYGENKEIEIWAMATNAGDDITLFKLSGEFPETASGD